LSYRIIHIYIPHVLLRDATPTVPQDVTIHKTAYIRLRLKCDGTRTGTRFCPLAKRTRPFKSAGGVSSVDYWQPSCAHQR